MTPVRGSSSQNCSRSLPLTSLLLPTDTNSEIPMPRRAAWLEQLDAEPTRLREERDVAVDRLRRREGRVETHFRIGVRDAEAVRSDHAHAVGAGGRNDRALERGAGRVELGETGREHDQPVHALARALLDELGYLGGGTDDHRQVDRSGDLEDGAERGDAVDRRRVRIDRVHLAAEAGVAQVPHDGVADLARRAARTDHRDRSRREQTCDRRGFRVVLASGDRPEGIGRRNDREAGLDGAGFEVHVAHPPGRSEHLQHRGIARQRLRGERVDPVRRAR